MWHGLVAVSLSAMGDIFRMPDYTIMPGKRFRQIADAPPTNPPVPDLIEVTSLPKGKGTVEFVDVPHGSTSFTLPTAQFRQVYDPAT